MRPALRISSVRGVLSFLWRLFGFIGAALGLRRWWRTLVNDEEPWQTRLLAGALLLLMATLLVWSLFLPYGRPASPVGEAAQRVVAPTVAPVPAADSTEIVVDFSDDLSLAAIDRVGDALKVDFEPNSPVAVDERLMVADLSGLSASRRQAVLADLQADPRVEAADYNDTYQVLGWRAGGTAPVQGLTMPSAVTPNDPRYPEQWHLNLIGMPAAWEKADGKGAVVAVIDTGCAFETKDGLPAASDLKGTKYVKPYDFTTNSKRAYDDHGHGTHVAGTIAQTTNNGHGCAGVAPGASIMPLKVLSAGGSGTVGDIADAIEYAAKNGANVINMSLGGPRPSSVLAKACRMANQMGVTIVCAAGNSGREGVGYPAAYPECIAVSSVGPSGELAFYSSWGEQIAIAAPGGNFRSPSERSKGVLQNTVYEGQDVFEFWQGTSMASPHVAGVAALIYQTGVHGPAGIRAQLRNTASKKDDAKRYGAGIVNAAAAVGAAKGQAHGFSATGASNGRGWLAPRTAPVTPLRAPLALALAVLALLALAFKQLRSGGYWLGGLAVIMALTCVGTGFAGRLIAPVAGSAAWPLVALLLGFGVRGLRPVLVGLCAGYAAATLMLGLMDWAQLPWMLANCLAALLLLGLAARASSER